MSDDDLDPPEPDDGAEQEPGEPDNAADEIKAARKERKLVRHRREAEDFWRGVFASEVGRREMWSILLAGRFNEQPFQVGPNGFPQPEATWFAWGQKEFVRRLHDMWDAIDHEGVYLMKREEGRDNRYAKSKPTAKGAL